MKRRIRDELKGPFIAAAGWLFADMLLAIAMLFMTANTLGQDLPPPLPPLITKTVIPKPTSIAYQRILEHNFCRMTIDIGDPNRFSQDMQFAINTLEPKILAEKMLRGRQVGTAIVYGGASNVDQIAIAQAIASQVYKVLQNLGNKKIVFGAASYYEPLFVIGTPPNVVTIDVYLTIQPNRRGETCNASTHQPS